MTQIIEATSTIKLVIKVCNITDAPISIPHDMCITKVIHHKVMRLDLNIVGTAIQSKPAEHDLSTRRRSKRISTQTKWYNLSLMKYHNHKGKCATYTQLYNICISTTPYNYNIDIEIALGENKA